MAIGGVEVFPKGALEGEYAMVRMSWRRERARSRIAEPVGED